MSVRPTLLFFFSLILALLFISNAIAQSDARPYPPDAVVLEIHTVFNFNPDDISYQAFGNFTFKLSDQDYDQTNGAFNYTMWQDGIRIQTSTPPHTPPLDALSIPGRTGWMYWPFTFAGSAGSPSNFTFNFTAGNTTSGFESLWSCSLQLDVRINGSFDQCGDMIESPSGVGLVGIRSAQVSQGIEGPISSPALTDVRWHLSANDTNQTNGTFNYWMSQGPTIETLSNYTGMIPNHRSPGVMNFSLETFTSASNQRFPLYATVLARDPLTHQRSNYSCTAFVSGGSPFDVGSCGTFTAEIESGSLSDSAIFPFLDLTDTSDRLGMETGTFGAILTGLTIFGLTMMGLVAGRIVLSFIGLTVGICLCVALGIFAPWMLIIVFMGAVSVIVSRFMAPSQGASE